jgi:nucleoside-diphosphate-sugar epimerase
MSISEIEDVPAPASKIAVVGAGGYFAVRLMRSLRGHPSFKGVGIVRSAKSLAQLSNCPLDVRVVDTSREEELAKALSDCDTVVNAVNGDVSRVREETQGIYTAAARAKCKTFIHLSSAVVFGRAESPDLNDESDPDTRNWMLYARGKAEGELFLREAMARNKAMRTVTLRPGLIWGPGANWAIMVGEQFSRGSICLSNSGQGIANLIYVDNLVRMILAVHGKENGPSGFYNVGDLEKVTWRQYYEGLGKRLGYPESYVRTWPGAHLPLTPKVAFEWCLQQKSFYRVAKWFKPRVGLGVKAAVKKLVKGESYPPAGLQPSPSSAPRLTREHWALQNTAHRLSVKKLLEDYGPIELETTENALDSTASWLRFAGYAALEQPEVNGALNLAHIW